MENKPKQYSTSPFGSWPTTVEQPASQDPYPTITSYELPKKVADAYRQSGYNVTDDLKRFEKAVATGDHETKARLLHQFAGMTDQVQGGNAAMAWLQQQGGINPDLVPQRGSVGTKQAFWGSIANGLVDIAEAVPQLAVAGYYMADGAKGNTNITDWTKAQKGIENAFSGFRTYVSDDYLKGLASYDPKTGVDLNLDFKSFVGTMGSLASYVMPGLGIGKGVALLGKAGKLANAAKWATGLTGASSFLQTFPLYQREALANGADIQEATLFALPVAAVNSVIETANVPALAKALGISDDAAKVVVRRAAADEIGAALTGLKGQKWAPELFMDAAEKVAKNTLGVVRKPDNLKGIAKLVNGAKNRVATGFLEQGITEGGEEFVQSLVENSAKVIFNNLKGSDSTGRFEDPTFGSFAFDAIYGTLLGALVGTGMGTLVQSGQADPTVFGLVSADVRNSLRKGVDLPSLIDPSSPNRLKIFGALDSQRQKGTIQQQDYDEIVGKVGRMAEIAKDFASVDDFAESDRYTMFKMAEAQDQVQASANEVNGLVNQIQSLDTAASAGGLSLGEQMRIELEKSKLTRQLGGQTPSGQYAEQEHQQQRSSELDSLVKQTMTMYGQEAPRDQIKAWFSDNLTAWNKAYGTKASYPDNFAPTRQLTDPNTGEVLVTDKAERVFRKLVQTGGTVTTPPTLDENGNFVPSKREPFADTYSAPLDDLNRHLDLKAKLDDRADLLATEGYYQPDNSKEANWLRDGQELVSDLVALKNSKGKGKKQALTDTQLLATAYLADSTFLAQNPKYADAYAEVVAALSPEVIQTQQQVEDAAEPIGGNEPLVSEPNSVQSTTESPQGQPPNNSTRSSVENNTNNGQAANIPATGASILPITPPPSTEQSDFITELEQQAKGQQLSESLDAALAATETPAGVDENEQQLLAAVEQANRSLAEQLGRDATESDNPESSTANPTSRQPSLKKTWPSIPIEQQQRAFELATNYLSDIRNPDDFTPAQWSIYQATGGTFKVKRDSFVQFADENVVTEPIARTYFDNETGRGIDQIAEEANVSENDVVDYILTFPRGEESVRSALRKRYDTEFKEITGKELRKNTSEIVRDLAGDMVLPTGQEEISDVADASAEEVMAQVDEADMRVLQEVVAQYMADYGDDWMLQLIQNPPGFPPIPQVVEQLIVNTVSNATFDTQNAQYQDVRNYIQQTTGNSAAGETGTSRPDRGTTSPAETQTNRPTTVALEDAAEAIERQTNTLTDQARRGFATGDAATGVNQQEVDETIKTVDELLGEVESQINAITPTDSRTAEVTTPFDAQLADLSLQISQLERENEKLVNQTSQRVQTGDLFAQENTPLNRVVQKYSLPSQWGAQYIDRVSSILATQGFSNTQIQGIISQLQAGPIAYDGLATAFGLNPNSVAGSEELGWLSERQNDKTLLPTLQAALELKQTPAPQADLFAGNTSGIEAEKAAKAKLEANRQQIANLQGRVQQVQQQKLQAIEQAVEAASQQQELFQTPEEKRIADLQARKALLARQFSAKIGGQLNSGLDPEAIKLGIEYFAVSAELGIIKFRQFVRDFMDTLGFNQLSDAQLNALKVAYTSAYTQMPDEVSDEMDDPKTVKKVTLDEVNNDTGTTGSLESDSPRGGLSQPLGSEVIQSSQPGRPQSGTGAAGQSTSQPGQQPQSQSGLFDNAAFTIGESGNQQLSSQQQSTGTSATPAGGDQRGGSRINSYDGVQSQRDGSTAVAETPAASRSLTTSDKLRRQAEAENIPVTVADRENIDATLPFLMEGQREDVHFAEQRFAKPDGYGVVFTNGTGTGKTFLALGAIKRMIKRGKGNILVVVPNAAVINEWVTSALGLTVTPLVDTKDAGQGVSITTYANFGQNDALATRQWDMLAIDEAHNLMQSAGADETAALSTLRAITYHPKGHYALTQMQNRDQHNRIVDLRDRMYSNRIRMNNLDLMDEVYSELVRENEEMDREFKALSANYDRKLQANKQFIADHQGEKRPRALFLSATPFAYRENIQWAEGYLFEYPKVSESRGYNQPDGYQSFMIQHFGYRMRYNKLNKPEAEVNTDLMERNFNAWLQEQGVASSRVLDIDSDYQRLFALTPTAIGTKIDEGLQYLREGEDGLYYPLYNIVMDRFDYLQRQRLLEAIKAKESIPLIQQWHALGKKVVVFYDFNEGGGFSPFQIQDPSNNPLEIKLKSGETVNIKFNDLVKDFNARRPDLVSINTGEYTSPLVTLTEAFPNARTYNGLTKKSQKTQNIKDFNNDELPDANLLIVQSAANAGWSGHDKTSKFPRVLLNLGMPTQPTKSIQQEGRIYRTGQHPDSDSMFVYLNTGTNWERIAFAMTIAQRAATAENLGMGELARGLKDAFITAFEESEAYTPSRQEGKGGKIKDRSFTKPISLFEKAKTYYFSQQKKTSKTKSYEGTDYFATPEPLGLRMVQWAGIQTGDRALEPSSGHGAIARWFPEDIQSVAIEPSGDLFSRMALVMPGKKIQDSFENHNPVNKYEVIVMNPPFGTAGKTASEHVEKAATRHLSNGGRVVALVPVGSFNDKFDKWFYSTDEKGNLKYPGLHLSARVLLPSATFGRAGTSVNTQILVIDRIDDKQARQSLPSTQTIDLTSTKDINELFDRIESLDIRERPSLSGNVRSTVASNLTASREAVLPTTQSSAIQPTPAPIQQAVKEPVKTFHTKNQHDIFVVQTARFLERSEYDKLNNLAKQKDGYYSSFKGNGAIPGFVFREQEKANQFVQEANGTSQLNDTTQQTPTSNAGQWFSLDGKLYTKREEAQKVIDDAKQRNPSLLTKIETIAPDANTSNVRYRADYFENNIETPRFQLPAQNTQRQNTVGNPVLQQAIDRLSRAVPGVQIVANVVGYESVLQQSGSMRRTGGRVPKGFIWNGIVFLDPTQATPETAMHEFGHLWAEAARVSRPDLYQQGARLVRDSKYYRDLLADPYYSRLSEEQRVEEALASAIGDKGAQFITSARKSAFGEFLTDLWNAIKRLLGFDTSADLENMTLDQFVRGAAGDIMRGKIGTQQTEPVRFSLPTPATIQGSEVKSIEQFKQEAEEAYKNPKVFFSKLGASVDPKFTSVNPDLWNTQPKYNAQDKNFIKEVTKLTGWQLVAPGEMQYVKDVTDGLKPYHPHGYYLPGSGMVRLAGYQIGRMMDGFTSLYNDKTNRGKVFKFMIDNMSRWANLETVVNWLDDDSGTLKKLITDVRRDAQRKADYADNIIQPLLERLREKMAPFTTGWEGGEVKTIDLETYDVEDGEVITRMVTIPIAEAMALVRQADTQVSSKYPSLTAVWSSPPQMTQLVDENPDGSYRRIPRGAVYSEEATGKTHYINIDYGQYQALKERFETGVGAYTGEAEAFQALKDVFNNEQVKQAVKSESTLLRPDEEFVDVADYYPLDTFTVGDARQQSRSASRTLDENRRLLQRTGAAPALILRDPLLSASGYANAVRDVLAHARLVDNINNLQTQLGNDYEGLAKESVLRYLKHISEDLKDHRANLAKRRAEGGVGVFVDSLMRKYTQSVFGLNIGLPLKQTATYGAAYGQGIINDEHLRSREALGTLARLTAGAYRDWEAPADVDPETGRGFTGSLSGAQTQDAELLRELLGLDITDPAEREQYEKEAATLIARATYRQSLYTGDVEWKDTDLNNVSTKGKQTLKKLDAWMNRYGMAAMRRADVAVILAYREAAKQQAKAEGLTENTPEFRSRVTELTENVVYATNIMGQVSDQTPIQRATDWLSKLMGLYSGQQQKILNMVMARLSDWAKTGSDEDWSKLASAFGWGVVANAIWVSTVSAGASALMALLSGDEPKEEWLSQIGFDTVRNVTGMVPSLGSAAADYIISLNDNVYGNEGFSTIPALESFQNGLTALNDTKNYLLEEEQGKRDKALNSAVYKTTDFLTKSTGLPSSVARLLREWMTTDKDD